MKRKIILTLLVVSAVMISSLPGEYTKRTNNNSYTTQFSCCSHLAAIPCTTCFDRQYCCEDQFGQPYCSDYGCNH